MFSQKGTVPSGTQPQPQQTPHSSSKQHPWNPCPPNGEINLTAAKRQEHNPLYTQLTPKPQRKILLYGENHSRFLFPLVRDREIGIEATYQNIVIESVPPPPRSTTTTTGRPPARNCNAEWSRPSRTSTTYSPPPPTPLPSPLRPPTTRREPVIDGLDCRSNSPLTLLLTSINYHYLYF
jgi:hypothetical protein